MAKPFIQLNFYTVLALGLLGVALYQAYAPLLRDKDGVVALTKSIETISPTQLADKVKASKGKPLLVYFYASWCDACRTTTPLLAGYIRNRRLEDFNLIAVALEDNGYALAAYLNEKDYAGLWTPYLITELEPTLAALSPQTPKGIPLVLAYDARGKLHTSLQGTALRASTLDATISTLKQERNP